MALVVIGTDEPTRPAPRPGGRRSQADLRSAAHRVATDLRMVRALSRKALAGEGLSPDVRAAVGEACLLHVWSLREFLYGGGHRRHGVIASDYFPDGSDWEALRPPLPESLDQAWHRLADTVKPVSSAEPGRCVVAGRRPYLGFATDLIRVTEAFLEALPEDRADWFIPES